MGIARLVSQETRLSTDPRAVDMEIALHLGPCLLGSEPHVGPLKKKYCRASERKRMSSEDEARFGGSRSPFPTPKSRTKRGTNPEPALVGLKSKRLPSLSATFSTNGGGVA